MMHDHDELHDRGLQFDLSTLFQRRRVLGLFAGAGLATLVGCSNEPNSITSSSASPTATAGTATSAGTPTSAGTCTEIPQETAGPYPGDGSNGPNILSQSGIVRRDIRSSFGSASGVAQGVPLTINLTVSDAAKACAALVGAAVYLWQCDRDGAYSMYSPSAINQNYLRGVQETDSAGKVTFTSIFPACYAGRWPHIHFEMYPSLAQATSSANKITTSQIALPQDACEAVYATDGYSQSVRNLSQVSLQTDSVFRDGWASEMATVTGTVSVGLSVGLSLAVSPN